MRVRLSPVEIASLARVLLEKGMHPSRVRAVLAEQGLHWSYGFTTHNAGRERLRRLRQQGLGLCTACHAASYRLDAPVNVCPACLDAKWSTAPTPQRQR